AAIGIKVNYTSYQGNQIFTAILAPKYPATYFILQEDPTVWQETQFDIAKTATWNPFHVDNPTVTGYIKTIQTGSASQADAAAKNHELGLDTPLLSRYFTWLGHAVSGNFGASWLTSQPVTTAITNRLEVTLTLVLGAVVVSAIVSAVLGVWAALRGGWVDRLV